MFIVHRRNKEKTENRQRVVHGSLFIERGRMGFSFEKLNVYNKAKEYVNDIYLLTKTFPRDEMFGLTSQLRRAAVSIPVNITEGSARTKKDFNRFIDMARGSIFECVAILRTALKQEYLNQKRYIDLEDKLTSLSRMLSGLKRSISQ